ncbi:MAG: membrane protein insertase YidC [Clostridia bacterium]|jgi:YidC/Oxa1 family membrane protein insertase|nr:membrane protein insertase YidC [Clostridia bacterium]
MTTSFFLTRWLYLAMSWVYEQISRLFGSSAASMGHGGVVVVLTIFIFTLAIRAATSVGDISSRKSSMKMQEIQPELNRLQKKYKDDPQKLNIEQRKIMKEHGVSTFGGCLPMLLMFPLLIMFFNAFRAWANEQMLSLVIALENGQGLEMFQGFRFLWITNIWRPDNLSPGGALMSAQEFWTNFSTTNQIKNFIFYNNNSETLNEILYKLHFFTVQFNETGAMEYVYAADNGAAFKVAYEAFVRPITDSMPKFYSMTNGYAVLPLLAGATGFLQSFLQQKMQPQTAQNNQQANSSMKVMMYLMPLISVFFCYQYDATFAFYWTFSNIFALLVNVILNFTMFKKPKTEQVEAKAKA